MNCPLDVYRQVELFFPGHRMPVFFYKKSSDPFYTMIRFRIFLADHFKQVIIAVIFITALFNETFCKKFQMRDKTVILPLEIPHGNDILQYLRSPALLS